MRIATHVRPDTRTHKRITAPEITARKAGEPIVRSPPTTPTPRHHDPFVDFLLVGDSLAW